MPNIFFINETLYTFLFSDNTCKSGQKASFMFWNIKVSYFKIKKISQFQTVYGKHNARIKSLHNEQILTAILQSCIDNNV